MRRTNEESQNKPTLASGKPGPDLRSLRERSGRSQQYVAIHAGTSAQTVRMYELGHRAAIKDARKAEALDRVYADFAAQFGETAAA